MIEGTCTDINTLSKALDDATALYKEACKTVEDAERIKTQRVNSLNQAQKHFDAAVAAMKKVAPYGSDWHIR